VYWAGPSRLSWSRFGQDLTKLVAQSAPDIFVVTYTEPGLGPVQFGHVVVQGRDLRVGPGQPLVLVDPVDPSTWRVGPAKTLHRNITRRFHWIGRATSDALPGGGRTPPGPRGTPESTPELPARRLQRAAADMPTQTASTVAGSGTTMKTAGGRIAM